MNQVAKVSKKIRARGSLGLWVVSVLCLVAIVFIVYNIVIVPNIFYVISYLLGIVLGASYILVCLNEIYTPWVAINETDLLIKCWDNCFFPYRTFEKFQFFGELLPSKSVCLRVPVSEISKVIIGTKTFIKRSVEDEAFLDAVAIYENASYSANNKALEKMDILYVSTFEGESVFMNVTDFDAKQIMRLMRELEKINPDAEIKLSGRKYRSFGGEKEV